MFGHRVQLVRSSRLLHFHDQRRLTDRVPDTKSGQSECLRHRADHQQPVVLPYQIDRRDTGEFGVRFVDEHDAGRLAQRPFYGLAGHQRSGGIVRRAEVQQLRSRGQQRIDVGLMRRQLHTACIREGVHPCKNRDHRKRGLRSGHEITRLTERAHGAVENVVGPAAGDDHVRRDARVHRERLLELRGVQRGVARDTRRRQLAQRALRRRRNAP